MLTAGRRIRPARLLNIRGWPRTRSTSAPCGTPERSSTLAATCSTATGARSSPATADENAYLERHDWDEYGEWFLGLTDGASDETKARHAFVFGDFRRVHRTGLIACVYRASEWRHKAIELAAHDLLQRLDEVSGITAKATKATSRR